MPKRSDTIEMTNVQKNDNGFLHYDFLAAQTGVFPYLNWDGSISYELKHPDDLLKDEVVQQLNTLPITDGHPWELVNIDNAKDYVKGMTDNSSNVRDNKLAGHGVVFDAALIGNILSGSKKQCSLGFECDVVEESGEYNGVHYDKKQTNFKLNHLAMVEEGRCGPECSAKIGDSAGDAMQIRFDQVEQFKNKQKGDGKMAKIKLDGVDFEVDEKVKARIDSLESTNTELTKQVGQLEGKLDGKDDEIQRLKNENETLQKTQLDDEALGQAIESRLALIEETKYFLGDEYDFKGKSEQDIKIDCIKAINKGFVANGKSEEYINARFDTMKEFITTDTASVGDNNLKFINNSNKNDGLESKRKARLNIRK